MHRRTISILLALLFPASTFAQQQQKLNIEQATVFLIGAELVSSTTLSLVKGDNEVLFTNVAGDINTQSLAVSATNDIVVTSTTFQNNYLDTAVLSPHPKILKDSIQVLRNEQDELNTKITVLKEEVAILFNNQKIGGENTGLSVAELTKMLDVVNARMEGYLNQQKKEEHLLSKINEHLEHLNKQLLQQQKKEQPGGQLLVKFYAKEATTSDITVDYVTAHAGWSPSYDITASNTNSPIILYYKANIHQNSGVKWNNVHLILSTGNPQEGMQVPVLNPLYLSFSMPRYVAARNYTKRLVDMDKPISNIMMKEEESSVDDYVTVDNAGINTSFDIDIPYTIPADGQQHLVAIKKHELPATYCYYVVPKLDKDVFLQAQITNWQNLNLLPGNTNIFYEGTYVGQGSIDSRVTGDTMTLSLGRDKKIIVKRDRDMMKHSMQSIGSNQRETFAYTITIRNSRKEPVNLVVQDQLPVSSDKDIVVEDTDTPGAALDETTGGLKWLLLLNANETKTINLEYTVKYPKGRSVDNLR